MPDECINALNIRPDGVYVDCTLGGGGHSSLILDKLTTGRLIGIDKDEDALTAAEKRLSNPNFTPIRGNFHDFSDLINEKVNGVLIDLGVSSFQLDTGQRGFSYRLNGPLDMRMDNRSDFNAAKIVNNFTEKEIADILFQFGEERHSRRISRAICQIRETEEITTTLQLAKIIENATPRKKPNDPNPAMRSFMALRIAVNNELTPLKNVLINIAENSLKQGGRIAVITFHSLEDRIVKNAFQELEKPCTCPRDIPYCICNKQPVIKKITKKPTLPSKNEIENNSRARSAKLRIAERI